MVASPAFSRTVSKIIVPLTRPNETVCVPLVASDRAKHGPRLDADAVVIAWVLVPTLSVRARSPVVEKSLVMFDALRFCDNAPALTLRFTL
jgi:hypothetical protein